MVFYIFYSPFLGFELNQGQPNGRPDIETISAGYGYASFSCAS